MKPVISFLSVAFICMMLCGFLSCEGKNDDQKSNYKTMIGKYADFNDETVRAMLLESMKAEWERADWITPEMRSDLDKRKTAELMTAHIEPIGIDYRIVRVVSKETRPISSSVWIVNRSGLVSDVNLQTLTTVFKGYPTAKTDAEKDELIQKFRNILHSGGVVAAGSGRIINSLTDIPEYDKAKLDPDLESTVRAPYTMDIIMDHSDKVIGQSRILYTYRRGGGVVSRYRFQFNSLGALEAVDRIDLGTEIGACVYYQ